MTMKELSDNGLTTADFIDQTEEARAFMQKILIQMQEKYDLTTIEGMFEIKARIDNAQKGIRITVTRITGKEADNRFDSIRSNLMEKLHDYFENDEDKPHEPAAAVRQAFGSRFRSIHFNTIREAISFAASVPAGYINECVDDSRLYKDHSDNDYLMIIKEKEFITPEKKFPLSEFGDEYYYPENMLIHYNEQTELLIEKSALEKLRELM
jgi:negative regulator of genetic competence, sporulation and motility